MFKISEIPNHLSRITSSGKFIKEIDGLRFIAIFTVLVQHLNERFVRNTAIAFSTRPLDTTIGFLAEMGFIGVYIFFVISGFVLALPFALHKLKGGRSIELKNYYWRRVTRLEPPYIFWMTIFFIAFLVTKHQDFFAYLPHYLANLTYTHAIFYNDWSPFNPPTWTLEVEIQFYILAPFLALGLFSIKHKLFRRIGFLLAIVLILLLQQFFFPDIKQLEATQDLYKQINLNITAHIHYFLIGFLLVDIYICDWEKIEKKYIFDVLALIALTVMAYGFRWNFEFVSRLLFTASLFVFFYSAFQSVLLNKFITNRWIMAIGGMCYTIYLIHLPMAEFIIKFTKGIELSNIYELNLLVQLLIFIPITLVVSGIFFLLIEKPCMDKDWPQKLMLKFKKAK
ncbi:MAG: acyltransferase [Pedobacter sp.]|nr:MAG: acyltransferase [Pedobacter sp.]